MKVTGQEGFARDSGRQMRGGSSGMHAERGVTIDSVRFDKVTPHPLSTKVYGNPTPSVELLKSIEHDGLIEPIIVIDNSGCGKVFTVLAGNTRVEAWRKLYESGRIKGWMPAYIKEGLSELDQERMVLESNIQRVKTAEQLGREFIEFERLEAIAAKDRLRTKSLPPTVRTEAGEAAQKAAKKLGISPTTAKRIKKIVTESDAGNVVAQEVLDKVNSKVMSITRGYEEVKRREPKDPDVIRMGKEKAKELTKLFSFSLPTEAEVTRSTMTDLFHLTLKHLNEKDMRAVAAAITGVLT